ncbi:MAG: Holliday junction branch migration DNA helicase RuvB [Parcubacteria group bacterium]|nr:Holliday junction branch migration DNA helicase RuvB [Parcubacteria group bacterium]
MTTQMPHVTSPVRTNDELGLEQTLRPKTLDEYVGQTHVKKNLSILIEAARKRHEPIEHLLFYGPPGLGKTTLAAIVAKSIGTNLRTTSGPALERAGDVSAILSNLKDGDVLFIDEIHRMNHAVEEILYPAMEDFVIDIMLGKGPSARSVRLALPRFTLIGATTRIGLLSSPLRDRFGATYHLGFYSEDEIVTILARSARILSIPLEPEGGERIAQSARKTPRVANRLLKRVRDFAQVNGHERITKAVAEKTLAMLAVDTLGLDETDRALLKVMIEQFQGGPVGVKALSAALAEEEDTIADVYEPFLMQIGFLTRTPRGRMVTKEACAHVNLPLPRSLIQSPLM